MTDLCANCGHPRDDHAEFVDNGLGSTKEDASRRHCLHGEYDGSPGGAGRACSCASFVSREVELDLIIGGKTG